MFFSLVSLVWFFLFIIFLFYFILFIIIIIIIIIFYFILFIYYYIFYSFICLFICIFNIGCASMVCVLLHLCVLSIKLVLISRHSNIVVVLVQVNVDNSITEGEENGRLLQAHAKAPG